MKKVLIITPFLDERGGVEVVTNKLVQSLRLHFQIEHLSLEKCPPQNILDKFFSKIFGNPYLTSKAFRNLDSSQYDFVICNGEYAWGIHHPKSIAYFHGSYWGLKKYNQKSLSLKNKLALTWRAHLQKLGARDKKVITVSEFMKMVLDDQGIECVDVIHNPIDLKLFSPIENRNPTGEYLFVGRNDYFAKGFDLLENLAGKNFKITCYSNYQNKNSKLMLKRMVANHELPKIFNEHQVLLFPSRFEAFGMAIAEAMSCGIPVLVHPVGIGHDLMKKIPEFVVTNFMDEAELRSKVDYITKNYEELSKKAREYAENEFSQKKFQDDWLKVLNA